MYCTHMLCFTYGAYVSHSMKLSINTEGSMQSLITQLTASIKGYVDHIHITFQFVIALHN